MDTRQNNMENVELTVHSQSKLKYIVNCEECYGNRQTKPDKWQTLACSRPHLVLWVKLDPSLNFWAAKEGYDYWPAKMMSYGEQNVRVIFFKGTEFVDVPQSSCFTYSQNTPQSMGTWRKDNEKDMKEALKEVNEYARNIEKKFGRFQIKSESVPFNQYSWFIHMHAMFPDFSGPHKILRMINDGKKSDESVTNSEDDQTEKSSDNIDDGIPNKKQRRSENQEQNDTENTHQPNNEAVTQDKFCWFCHSPKRFHTGYSCSKCFRVFHATCLKKNCENQAIDQQDDKWICPVCVSLKEAHGSVDKQTISKILKQIIDKVSINSEFKVLNNLNCIKMDNAIDLEEIDRKVDSQFYASFVPFLVDINIILHNCCCVNSDHKTTAENLVKLCTSEIKNASSCAECYERMHNKPENWQSLACSHPHLVLWIELNRNCIYWPANKGYRYWPAKLVSVGRKNVKAIYFDGSEFVEIPRSNCFIYSRNDLKSMKPTTIMVDPTDSMKVLKMVEAYAYNVMQKFGRFVYTLESVPFKNLDLHMKDMFPDYETDHTSRHERDEHPNKKRHLYEENTEIGSSSSSHSQLDTDFNPNPESSDINIQAYNDSLKHMRKFKISVMKSSQADKLTIQKQSDELKKLAAYIKQLEQDKENLRTGIQADLDKKSFDLETEKQRSSVEVQQLKVKHTNEVDKLKMEMETLQSDKQFLRNKLVNSHNLMLELEEKLKNKRNQHKIELETEKKRAADEKEKLGRKVDELEQKVTITLKEKSDVEAELKKKCDKLNCLLNSLMSED